MIALRKEGPIPKPVSANETCISHANFSWTALADKIRASTSGEVASTADRGLAMYFIRKHP